jgi:methylmalonyl-CoA mutase
VIVPAEIEALEAYGVTKVFSPSDGQQLGLDGMVDAMVTACDVDLTLEPPHLDDVLAGSTRALARAISCVEADALDADVVTQLRALAAQRTVPVLGITGTGGAGKSSLTDELLLRFRLDQGDKLRIVVLAVDPTRRRTGSCPTRCPT